VNVSEKGLKCQGPVPFPFRSFSSDNFWIRWTFSLHQTPDQVSANMICPGAHREMPVVPPGPCPPTQLMPGDGGQERRVWARGWNRACGLACVPTGVWGPHHATLRHRPLLTRQTSPSRDEIVGRGPDTFAQGLGELLWITGSGDNNLERCKM
jgi:hypothetical protein